MTIIDESPATLLRAQRELLAGQLAIDSEWGCDRWVEWAEKHVAALTPKEGT